MSDRELLELAAKAGGVKMAAYMPFTHCRGEGALTADGDIWNPLEDDGDALRLAVKLRFLVDVSSHRAMVTQGDGETVEHFTNADPATATRRAIVRAAADVGSSQ